jgi:hypothetical protein
MKSQKEYGNIFSVVTTLNRPTELKRPSQLICRIFESDEFISLRFEVFMAVTMNSGVFSDVTPCGSYKNLHFGGT